MQVHTCKVQSAVLVSSIYDVMSRHGRPAGQRIILANGIGTVPVRGAERSARPADHACMHALIDRRQLTRRQDVDSHSKHLHFELS